jgi:diguanylate cyclase (GGDEF)-like protein/PAS domain S-box-containing protein
MSTQTEISRFVRLTFASKISSGSVILISGLTLAGWTFGLPLLGRFFPGLAPMNPVTALTLILSGTALWLVAQDTPVNRISRRAGQALAFLVALAGGLKLGGYLLGFDLGIDQWLFQKQLQLSDSVLSRMAPNTALNFILLGLALLFLDLKIGRGGWLAEYLAVAALLNAFLVLLGYAYDVPVLYTVIRHTPMAFSSALGFLILCAGVLLSRPHRGMMSVITSPHLGGVLTRRLLPAALSLPIVLGWVRLKGQHAMLFSNEFGIALFAVMTAAIASALLLWTASSLDRVDADRRQTETTLRASEQRNRLVVEASYNAFIEINADDVIIDWNPQAEATFGWSRNEAVGRSLAGTIIPERYRGEYRKGFEALMGAGEEPILNKRIELMALRRSGQEFPVELTISTIQTENYYSFIAFLHDITERKELEEHLRQIGLHDALTGLPNRILLTDRLNQAMSRTRWHKRLVATLFLDLDGFKTINDTLGHEIGDRMLKALAERLQTCLRDGDTVARLGGDEFVIILADVAKEEDIPPIVQKILHVLAKPIQLDRHELAITTSIGISLFPNDDESVESLLKKADIAMYQAKRDGKNRFNFYSALF